MQSNRGAALLSRDRAGFSRSETKGEHSTVVTFRDALSSCCGVMINSGLLLRVSQSASQSYILRRSRALVSCFFFLLLIIMCAGEP